MAKWAAEGCHVDLLVCPDGSKGTWDPSADLTTLIATRQAEQERAAKAIGIDGEIVMLGWVDGEVEPTRDAVSQVAREIRRLRPQVVLSHDPWKRYRFHPDHRNVGWIVLDAVVAARDPHFFPEHGLAHHRPDYLLLFEADEPDHAEGVTGFTDAKLAALLEHQSQYVSTMGIADPDDAEGTAAFRQKILERLATTGQAYGLEYAEEFKVMEP